MSKFQLNSATENISITLPGYLIELIDEYCQRKDFTRSNFIKRCVKSGLMLSCTDDLDFLETIYNKRVNGVVSQNNNNNIK